MNLITKVIAQCAMTSVFSSVAYDRISPVRIPPSLLSGTALTPRLPILIIHTFFFYDSPIKRVVVKKAAFFGQAAVRGERGQLPRPWPKANVRILNQNTLGWGVNSKNEDIIGFKKSESSKTSSYMGWFGRSSMRLHPTFARCHLQRASQLICRQSKDAK